MSANSVKISTFRLGELLRLQQPDQLLELVVVLRLELPRLVEEVARSGRGRGRSRRGSRRPCTRRGRACSTFVEQLRRDDVLVGVLVVVAVELERQLRCVAEDLGVLELPALEPLLLGVGLAVHLDEREELLEQRSHDCSKAQTELSNRLRKLVRISPTTWYWRFFSIGSIDSSAPL